MSRPNQRGRIRGGAPVVDTVAQHRDWLALVEVTGPFLSLPVLRQTWPTLDPFEKSDRESLRRAHAEWRVDPETGRKAWVDHILRTLLAWGGELRWIGDGTGPLAVEVAEHDTTIGPSFVLVEPGTDDGEVTPADCRLLGFVCEAAPTARVHDSTWAATPVDRLAQLCRHHDVELGLATDGRWWALVWAPRGGVTSTAVFDSVSWPESAERDVVRAFCSLLGRRRFFSVPESERLPALLAASEDAQEDITEALGGQVRQAVELLVAAFGRVDVRERRAGRPGLEQVAAHEVYRAAVSVMMRIVFLLFAEERRLLPSDNELYAQAYSAGRLCAELEQRAVDGSEDELEGSTAAWHRLIALFAAVHDGVEHPRLHMHAHDGSLFDPDEYSWLSPAEFPAIDDRTVLRMLQAVQHVQVGTGRNRERRTLSFRQLDVEQIGYVYEGLLSYDGFRADDIVVGLAGKAGMEEEIKLVDLEAIGRDVLAEILAERYKRSGIGSVKALDKRLVPGGPTEQEDARKKLLAVTDGDYPLAERLLPFAALIRRDLRDLPVVILPGALYVTESPLRRNTGTHYTPRELATEVVEHALEPLIYTHGPLQTADRTQWRPKTAKQILELKVADIAMGSAAFLVAAARYLGQALLDAWVREGLATAPRLDDTRARDADEDPLVVDARRQIIEHCLYGVDINPMAVEMAKLSLWLVSMDDRNPFTFLDDRLVAGDSLLGITNLEQLEYLNLDPTRARELYDGTLDQMPDVRSAVARLARRRRDLVDIELGDDPIAALGRKRALLADIEQETRQFQLLADLTVGAALAGSRKRTGSRDPRLRAEQEDESDASRDGLFLETVAIAGKLLDGTGEFAARQKRRQWLATDQVAGGFDRQPLQWPLVFPEVFEQGGFDAVIGNPPFLGGPKLTPVLGSAYREHLAVSVANGVRATNVDLIAYFALRLISILCGSGQAGVVATNSLAQGDTRKVGLDQAVERGMLIRRSVKSRPWPSRSATLEYCAVWLTGSQLGSGANVVADEEQVAGISSTLDATSRVGGQPQQLFCNAGIAYIGHHVNGLGFTLDRAEVDGLVAVDARSTEVVLPYLVGQDLNSSPTLSASRWIINFKDWDYTSAAVYVSAMDRLDRLVRPERATRNRESHRKYWWRYADYRRGMENAIAGLEQVIAMTIVSRTAIPVMVSARQVLSNKLVVFASSDLAFLAFLSSSLHYWWAVRGSATLKADLQYAPSDVFGTLPLVQSTSPMGALGEKLSEFRQNVMISRQSGLTKTYNLVFDPNVHDEDIVELRRVHREIDIATVRAYGWDDLVDQLDHGFHPAGRDLRYTIGPAAQREVLDRLLELNHVRYAEEVAQGLHDKKTRKAAAPKKSDGLW